MTNLCFPQKNALNGEDLSLILPKKSLRENRNGPKKKFKQRLAQKKTHKNLLLFFPTQSEEGDGIITANPLPKCSNLDKQGTILQLSKTQRDTMYTSAQTPPLTDATTKTIATINTLCKR